MTTATFIRRAPQGAAAPVGAEAPARPVPPVTWLYWFLRVGVAAEFIGHGLAGAAHSKAWFPYFKFFGISQSSADHHWFYVTATCDITFAILTLIRPMRVVLMYMAFWGLFTAILRPVTGESVFELVERGANYGMPLAFLLLAGVPMAWRDLVTKVRPPESLDREQVDALAWVVRISIALLLMGHGGLGIWAHKKEWADFFGFFGISAGTVASAHLSQYVGVFEIVLGLAVLVKPVRGLIVFVLVWKLGTELLRPLVGQPMFQFIERSGDYVLPVGLLLLAGLQRTLSLPAGFGERRGPTISTSSTSVRHAQPEGRPYPQQWHTTEVADKISSSV
jgi:hypothetical protein